MSIKLHWFLPTSGDSRSLVGAGQGVPGEVRGGLKETLSHGFREPTIDYLADVARTAEKLGFEGVLTPTGTFCEDAWLTTAALLRETSRLKFLVAFRPGVINPVLAAQMAAAYQRISDGRLMLNIVTGGEPREQARFGDTAPKAERYARPRSSSRCCAAPGTRRRSTSSGKYFERRGCPGERRRSRRSRTSTSAARPGPAGPVAAKHADVYLTWGEPLELVREKITWMRELAEAEGRTLRFGLRIHTLSRDTSEEAWAARTVAARRARPGHRRQGPGRAQRQRVDRAAADAGAAQRALVVHRRP